MSPDVSIQSEVKYARAAAASGRLMTRQLTRPCALLKADIARPSSRSALHRLPPAAL
jgi:hypothetical protein